MFGAACLALAGCAGMTEAECRGADWQALGERDGGIYGMQARVDQYAHECRTFNVAPAENEYMAGWRYGYAEFLRRMNGSECCP